MPHIWHHEDALRYRAGCNFGITSSLWDWLFGTGYEPGKPEQPETLGFPRIERYPANFINQEFYPFPAWVKGKPKKNSIPIALASAR